MDKKIDTSTGKIIGLNTFCKNNDIPMKSMIFLMNKNMGVKAFKIGRRYYITKKDGELWIDQCIESYLKTKV